MPNKITFATPKTLVQPSGVGLVIEAPQEQDHILGASGPEFQALVKDGQWINFIPNSELQRNRNGDTFMCVSYSLNNIHEFLFGMAFNETINKSDLFLGSGSGTIRGQGNSKRTVAEWNRLHGFVLETEYPYTPETTLDQAYAPLTRALLDKGMKQLDFYSFNYKWLADNSAASIMGGLTFSPVQVDVSGSYKTDRNGYITWDSNYPTYTHEVMIFGYEKGICWYVFDSETEQYLKFAWFYPFGSPMIHAVKKTMNIQILKKKNGSALCIKTFNEPSLIAFSGGDITAETLFKSIYGLTDFGQIPITLVDEWPFPIRHIFHSQPYQGE